MLFLVVPGAAWPLIPLRDRCLAGFRGWWVVGVVGWLWVENCIVDASIFVVCG